MKKILIALLLFAGSWTAFAQTRQFSWELDAMDGSRTGCVSSSASNIAEAMGTMKGCAYLAPNGKVFRGGLTPKVARVLLAAQPAMAWVKEVIGYSSAEMVEEYPECALWNWFVDEIMRATADSTGKQVDIGIVNTGGVRIDMSKGDILLDDIMSMFPFNNSLCYVALRGLHVRAVLNRWPLPPSRLSIIGRSGGRTGFVTVGTNPWTMTDFTGSLRLFCCMVKMLLLPNLPRK